MSTQEIICLIEKLRHIDENMDPITAMMFVFKYKLKKELGTETSALFEKIKHAMHLPTQRSQQRHNIHELLRDSFYLYVRELSPHKMQSLRNAMR